MKLSVLDLVPVIAPADAGTAYEQAVMLARQAEKWGYSRYWVAEHHDMPALACTAPEVFLAHIGARTERIRIGSGALLLPHYKPMKVAESFHMLAALYPGRIDLGIGRAPGGSANAAIALSGNFLENVRQLPETLKSLMALLEGRFECEGQPVTARPMPPTAPEVWMLGTNIKSAALAAEHGTGYVFGQFMSDSDAVEVVHGYRENFVPSAQGQVPRVIIAVGVVCADSEEEALTLAAGMPWLQGAESQQPQRRMLIGTVASVHEQLERIARDCEVDEFLLVTPIADYERRLRSYELISSIIS
ncbi:LLM class flavin-dependent oxidoreductase [Paenibacillus sp. CGMCC 1.16610]|uniref:MsnO8 family LLM class oxidoreductase n=1 Tax=Paenibacillus anseongense TaxID=2682845 RepID=A0ABW9U744_9BACL|nr:MULTISPECIES: LLM class flavin-dependent oxidoreductase [Paenibacillus]MBA2942071.1 LLM class flavin-dependent oxidoreductase [Paenibacillus sp. CGMCC 1.16610]MVQ35904.1 MsnO8 family LLM class oxidoreductase [Paenibacillus anseongense]